MKINELKVLNYLKTHKASIKELVNLGIEEFVIREILNLYHVESFYSIDQKIRKYYLEQFHFNMKR